MTFPKDGSNDAVEASSNGPVDETFGWQSARVRVTADNSFRTNGKAAVSEHLEFKGTEVLWEFSSRTRNRESDTTAHRVTIQPHRACRH